MIQFTCPWPQCNSTFPVKKSLNRHIRTVHQDQNIRCLVCGESFARKDNFDRHYQEQHGDKTELVECTVCGKKDRERVLDKHWNSKKCQRKQDLLRRCIQEAEHGSWGLARRNGNAVQSCTSLLQTRLDARSPLLASILAVLHIKVAELAIGSDPALRPHYFVKALNYRGLAMRLLQDSLENMASGEAVGPELPETYLSILALYYTDRCLNAALSEYHDRALTALGRRHFDKLSMRVLDRVAYYAVCHGLQNMETISEETQHDVLDHLPNRRLWDREKELRLLDVLCRAHSLHHKDALDKPSTEVDWYLDDATADTATADTGWRMVSRGALSLDSLAVGLWRRSDESIASRSGPSEETCSFWWMDDMPGVGNTQVTLGILSRAQAAEEYPSDVISADMLQEWHADDRRFHFPKSMRRRYPKLK